MFNGAQNIVVKDSSLTVNAHACTNKYLDRLLNDVAPNAILNAGGRADEVRCYPGTREEVVGKIEKWMDDEDSEARRILWLSGPAGAGKSAIIQTIAERCQERGIHEANFFFFRSDGTRNHAQPLVATLVYQLLAFYPHLNELIENCLSAKPLVSRASIEEQFKLLISAPVQTMQQSSLIHRPIVLIVDGLDECDDERQQEQILAAMHTLVRNHKSPFRVLVASRAEPHLVMSFSKIGRSAESIFLDDEYRPEDDIRRFVTAKFDEIRRVHHLAHTLGEEWPAKSDIIAITDKSSGQFIYAATVMRFIQYSTASPALSLLRIHGMRPSVGCSPLAHLDAVYSYIFSKAQDIEAVRLLLGAYFITKRGSSLGIYTNEAQFHSMVQLVGYDVIEIQSLFADLVAIVCVTPGPPIRLVFYHASMQDYLLNEPRAGIYFINVSEIASRLSSTCLQKSNDLVSWGITVTVLEHVSAATQQLSHILLQAAERKFPEDSSSPPTDNHKYNDRWKVLISVIHTLYFQTDQALYKHMLQRWVRFAYRNNLRRSLLLSMSFQAFLPILSDSEFSGRRYFEFYDWYIVTGRVKYVLGL